jgi:hypothetical protein
MLKSTPILIGAQGLRATLGILLGGSSAAGGQYSQCPVLVVRTFTGIKRVLLVTDGSPHSQRAVEYLAQYAQKALAQQPRIRESQSRSKNQQGSQALLLATARSR